MCVLLVSESELWGDKGALEDRELISSSLSATVSGELESRLLEQRKLLDFWVSAKVGPWLEMNEVGICSEDSIPNLRDLLFHVPVGFSAGPMAGEAG